MPLLHGSPDCARDSLRMLEYDISGGGLVLGTLIQPKRRIGLPAFNGDTWGYWQCVPGLQRCEPLVCGHPDGPVHP